MPMMMMSRAMMASGGSQCQENARSCESAGATTSRGDSGPARDLVDTAVAAGFFNRLVEAVQAAGLVETLKGSGPFTLFAPTDEAFAKVPAEALEAVLKDPEKLKAILTYHVVPGRFRAADLGGIDSLRSVQGGALKVDTSVGVKVGGAYVIKADVAVSNGVIHVIDSVLMPA